MPVSVRQMIVSVQEDTHRRSQRQQCARATSRLALCDPGKPVCKCRAHEKYAHAAVIDAMAYACKTNRREDRARQIVPHFNERNKSKGKDTQVIRVDQTVEGQRCFIQLPCSANRGNN